MIRVFIDGSEGTTGLRIHDRLPGRADIELLTIDPALRKDPDARRELLNSADIAFLCLPDAAAREAVAMVENPHTRILDTSTAHRTAAGWAYGFPELTAGHRTAVQGGTRIAVPGCHASGYLAAVRPLVEAGLLCPDAALCCTSLTGYSGGGRKMIAEYEAAERPAALDAPRIYGLTQQHKHLPEMRVQSGLTTAPVFLPIVADFYSGMLVSVPLPQGVLTRLRRSMPRTMPAASVCACCRRRKPGCWRPTRCRGATAWRCLSAAAASGCARTRCTTISARALPAPQCSA